MKAKIKATGEEIEVMQVYEKGDSFYVRLDMLSTTEVRYHISELEFEGIESSNQLESNYWKKLKHQAAISAMHGILAANATFTADDMIECKVEEGTKPKMVNLDDVCDWIEKHIFDFPWYDNEQDDFSSKDVANALRKAMEG